MDAILKENKKKKEITENPKLTEMDKNEKAMFESMEAVVKQDSAEPSTKSKRATKAVIGATENGSKKDGLPRLDNKSKVNKKAMAKEIISDKEDEKIAPHKPVSKAKKKKISNVKNTSIAINEDHKTILQDSAPESTSIESSVIQHIQKSPNRLPHKKRVSSYSSSVENSPVPVKASEQQDIYNQKNLQPQVPLTGGRSRRKAATQAAEKTHSMYTTLPSLPGDADFPEDLLLVTSKHSKDKPVESINAEMDAELGAQEETKKKSVTFAKGLSQDSIDDLVDVPTQVPVSSKTKLKIYQKKGKKQADKLKSVPEDDTGEDAALQDVLALAHAVNAENEKDDESWAPDLTTSKGKKPKSVKPLSDKTNQSLKEMTAKQAAKEAKKRAAIMYRLMITGCRDRSLDKKVFIWTLAYIEQLNEYIYSYNNSKNLERLSSIIGKIVLI